MYEAQGKCHTCKKIKSINGAGICEDCKNKWLEERRKGICGSDIAAIMGRSRWKSPLMVYKEKLGIKESDLSNIEAVHWGNVLEDAVAQEFMRRTGKKVIRSSKAKCINGWHMGNIDRKVQGEKAGLECKTANANKSHEWQDDEIPQEYLFQILWYMWVNEWTHMYIACLIGGQKFVWQRVERNDALIKIMVEFADDFWTKYVFTKTPPPATALDIKEFKNVEQETETIFELPANLQNDVIQLENVRKSIKTLDTHKKLLEAKIKQNMGIHQNAVCGNKTIKWTISEYSRFDTKRFREENAELEKQYQTTSVKELLTIK